jgi:hypothetical protein
VFVRTGTPWTQQAYLKASNTGAGDGFGFSVSLSGEELERHDRHLRRSYRAEARLGRPHAGAASRKA